MGKVFGWTHRHRDRGRRGGSSLLGPELPLSSACPSKWEERLKPYVFVGPALLFIGVIVLYPLVRTLIFAFFERVGRRVGRVRELQRPARLRRLPPDAVQQPALAPLRPGRRSCSPGSASRCSPTACDPRIGEDREVAHLRADGDQLRRRGDDLAVRLRVAAGGPAADRPAQLGHHLDSASTRSRGSSRTSST